MSTTTLIIIGVGVLLLVIGASQRKRLSLLFRSEVANLLEKAKNDIKIAKLKISDLKVNINNLVMHATSLYAEEQSQKDELKDLKVKEEELLKKAKKAKEKSDEMKAKEKLTLMYRIKDQILLTEQHIESLKSKRETIEKVIQKSKTLVEQYKIKVDGLAAKASANKILAKTVATDFLGETIEDNIKNAEIDINKQEYKQEYVINDSIISDDEYSDDVEAEFKKL